MSSITPTLYHNCTGKNFVPNEQRILADDKWPRSEGQKAGIRASITPKDWWWKSIKYQDNGRIYYLNRNSAVKYLKDHNQDVGCLTSDKTILDKINAIAHVRLEVASSNEKIKPSEAPLTLNSPPLPFPGAKGIHLPQPPALVSKILTTQIPTPVLATPPPISSTQGPLPLSTEAPVENKIPIPDPVDVHVDPLPKKEEINETVLLGENFVQPNCTPQIIASNDLIRLKPGTYVLTFDDRVQNPKEQWKLFFAGDKENYPIAIDRVGNLSAELTGNSLEKVQNKADEIGRITEEYRNVWIPRELYQVMAKVQEGMFPLRDKEGFKDCSAFAEATEEIGAHDLKINPEKYIEQTSKALDFLIYKSFDIIGAKAMNGELSMWNFNGCLDKLYLNQSARYMGQSRLPHVISELLFKKMLWMEWMIQSIKHLRAENRISFGWSANTYIDSSLGLGKRSEHTTSSLNEFATKPEGKKFQALLQDFRKAYQKNDQKFDIDESFKIANAAFLRLNKA